MRALCLILAILFAAPAAALTFDVRTDGTHSWILATGDLERGDADRFFDLFHDADKLDWVVFDSTGGHLGASLRLGQHIRTLGFHTLVPTGAECVSACFFAFIAGNNRAVQAGGRLGVHQFYDQQSTRDPADQVSDAQRAAAILFDYFSVLGIPTGALEKALVTPPDEMYEFSRSEMVDLELVTMLRPEDSEPVKDCPFPPGMTIKDPLWLYPECKNADRE